MIKDGDYIESISPGLNRVYACMPKSEALGVIDIKREFSRKGHGNPPTHLMKFISELIKANLVTEPKPGFFIRTKNHDTDPAENPQLKEVIYDTKKTYYTEIIDAQKQVLAALIKGAKDMSDDLDYLLIEIDEKLKAGADAEKRLTELRNLLGIQK